MHDTAGSLPSSSRFAYPLISFTGSNLGFHKNYCSFIEWKTCIFNYISWNDGWLWNQVLGIVPFEPHESAILFHSFCVFSFQHFTLWSLPSRNLIKTPSSGQEFSIERGGGKGSRFHLILCTKKYGFRFCFIKLSCVC